MTNLKGLDDSEKMDDLNVRLSSSQTTINNSDSSHAVVNSDTPKTPISPVFPTPEELVREALPPSLNIDAPFPPVPVLSKAIGIDPLQAASQLRTETQVQLQQLQTQLELATGWIKVKEIEKMTAQLKLEKINKDAAVSGQELNSIQREEYTRGSLAMKAKEVAVARLKEYKLRTELRVVTLREQLKKADLELENVKIVRRTQDMTSEIAEIKRYIAAVKGKDDEMAKLGGMHNPARSVTRYW
mmetsp:Transcript_12824/g.17526  ORF Transcript_12824/g.17526 Transcript_12824/m.17526 type:complete len:243 (-) Transcript_12824:14-742(-)